MPVVARMLAWTGANFVPLVLIPLAATLIWVSIWKIWLPRPVSRGSSARTVTTVDASAASRPAHKVTTIVKTAVAPVPSRRSETLAIVLLFVGVGAAVIGVFHDKIGSIELDRTGIKIDLTAAEQAGAAALVSQLARGGAPKRAYARGLARYVRAVAAGREPVLAAESEGASLSTAHAESLAARIADDVL